MAYHSKLKQIREERGVKEEEIARVLNTTVEAVRLFEKGKRKMKLHEYIELAKFYNLSLDYIAGLIDTPLRLH
ncbi:MAG: helix-turn-helix transcriptional regulator [Clostridia bacterium]|nr:helix-turn-helix transcriptional regulator [Clostridia bacterium]